MPTAIDIDVHDRWDAVAVMRRLVPYHSYLVQFAPEHWLVHAEAPGCHGEPLPVALDAIEESLAARQIESAAVRIDGQQYDPRAPWRGHASTGRGGKVHSLPITHVRKPSPAE